MTALPLRLAPEAARLVRDEVARAGGREVSFLAEVTRDRVVVNPRAVARGSRSAVLAVARDAPEGGLMIHNHPSGVLDPSDADLDVAARLHDEGLGSAIVSNRADRMYVVVEPPAPKRIELLDVDELEGVAAPGGAMASMAGYEDRAGQRAMLRFVAERFNEGGTGLVEAGTGTGKSMAYLVPAARWAVRNHERTVVSTNTINLQEQLVRKDIPLAEEVLGEEIRWALVKGRANYVSIRRAFLAGESAATLFRSDRSDEIAAVLEWLRNTDDGSLADLGFAPAPDVWEEVRSDTDACMRARCPYFQACHYQRARRRAAAADLLVVNHALFFSDLAVRIATDNFRDAAVLPPYRRVVFDEAHHLEDAATDRLGTQATRAGLFRAVSRLHRQGKGVLPSIEAAARSAVGPQEAEALAARFRRTRSKVEELRKALTEFFGFMEPWAEERAGRGPLRLGAPGGGSRASGGHGASGGQRASGGQGTSGGQGASGGFAGFGGFKAPGGSGAGGAASSAGLEPTADSAVAESLDRALASLADVRRELESLYDRLEGEEEMAPELEGRLLDLLSSSNRMDHAETALRRCLLPGPEDGPRIVRWIELRRPRRQAGPGPGSGARSASGGIGRVGNLVMATAPVEPGPILAEHLFGAAKTTVLTSATLTADGGFGYLKDRLGLSGGGPGPAARATTPTLLDSDPLPPPPDPLPPPAEAAFDSPFDYRSQACLVVPTGLPAPGRERDAGDAYHRAVAGVVHDVAERSGGGLFALFTSYAALRGVARELRARGAEARWPLQVQGEADRSALLQRFTESGAAVLLGTASFWEGVDVPGDPLRALVVQKLPFRVPTEPVTEARVEAMEERGKNSFWEFMVPDAAIRLKQGVGRLIRRRTDRGVVVLLDDRILRKRYGRVMRETLPPMPLVKGPWPEARRHVEAFYGGRPAPAAGR